MHKPQSSQDSLHLSGPAIVTGRAFYIGDGYKPRGLLYAQVVFSEYAHARIVKINTSKALAISGVAGVFTAQDIPGKNQIGHNIKDEPLLAADKVCYVGQPLAVVVARSAKIAMRAAKMVDVTYEKLPALLTIEAAVKANSYYVEPIKMECGNVTSAFREADVILTGEIRTPVQEHIYFETQRVLALPGEDNSITLHSATQSTAEVQEIVAHVLGIQSKDVTVDVKRLGGGFGGKERGATLWSGLAALAAFKLRHPVMLALSRKEDISFTGKRHPFRARYKIGATQQGKILAYEVEFCANGGAFADLSLPILNRAMFHADNAYFIPNVKIIGKACKTNLPPNTAFRGFGAPQGIFTIEYVIERLANKLELNPLDVRELNFYKSGEQTHFGQTVYEASHNELLARLKHRANICEMRAVIEKFNKEHAYVKRGIGIVPLKFGISFTFTPLNQGTALIWVYADGTISLSHGGIEMGQEINTKVAQVVAHELGVSLEKIRVESSNTQRNGNASPTAASSGADINCNAALDAAKQIKTRLAKWAVQLIQSRIQGYSLDPCNNRKQNINSDCKESDKDNKDTNGEYNHIIFEDNSVYDSRYPGCKVAFAELVSSAYMHRQNLGAQGYYRTPDIFFDNEKMQGSPFYYFLYGIGLVLVEVNILTGMHKLLKVHIVHETGRSLNKSIDVGQIHGAFFQGFGYSTMEELTYNNEGRYLANTLSTYKIPTFQDLPEIFEVDLVERDLQHASVFGSKAIGEPPIIYGLAVYFALRDALSAVDSKREIKLAIPATPEAIIQAINE